MMADPPVNTPRYAALGRRIKFYRELRNLSQRGLSDLIGRSEGYLPKVERGDSRPEPPTLRAIARWLDVDYTELATLAGYADAQPADVQVLGSSERAGILRQLGQLSLERLRRLNELRRLAFSDEEVAEQTAHDKRERVREDEEPHEEPPDATGLANT